MSTTKDVKVDWQMGKSGETTEPMFGITHWTLGKSSHLVYDHYLEVFWAFPKNVEVCDVPIDRSRSQSQARFIDATGDSYSLSLENSGSHVVRYNSDRPNITSVHLERK